MRAMRVARLTICGAVLLASASPATAQVSSIDLLTGAGSQIDGSASGIESGTSVGGDLDFDNDGLRDALVGAPFGNVGWVVRGQPGPLVNLAAPGAGAIRIDGVTSGDRTGISINAAGDVNGDNIDDLVIGADAHRGGGGGAWVVFGGSSAPVNLASLGPRGFKIEGTSSMGAGFSVDGAGNVNGDEYDDLIIGAPLAGDAFVFPESGQAFVVFGKPDPATVELGKLGTGGYPINGEDAHDLAGHAVAGAGDVNGDGRGDQIVGAPYWDDGAAADAGAAYVVFGKSNTTPIGLGSLGASGYRIEGEDAGDLLGFSVDDAGDMTGDGANEQIVGAPIAGLSLEGSAYVIRGKSTSSAVSITPGMAGPGYEMSGVTTGDNTGYDVAGVGDVNRDSRPDQIIGAPYNETGGRVDAGAAFVVYGRNLFGSFNLSTFTSAFGYRLDGAAMSDFAGRSVGGTGNIGGAGSGGTARDVIVGAPRGDANSRPASGSSYIVFGTSPFAIAVIGVPAIRPVFAWAPLAVANSAQLGGTVIRYRVTQPAQVQVRVLRVVQGRRVGRIAIVGGRLVGRVRCARGKPRRGRTSQRRCERFVRVGQFTRRHRRAGRQRVPFNPRVFRRVLRPGRYVLELRARDRSGKVHGPLRARFRIRR